MWKEAVVAKFNVPSWKLPGEIGETMQSMTIVGSPAKIKTVHLLDESHKH